MAGLGAGGRNAAAGDRPAQCGHPGARPALYGQLLRGDHQRGRAGVPDASVPVTSVQTFVDTPAGAAVLFSGESHPIMVVIPLGKGAVWALADPRWLANSHVIATGLAIALPLAQESGGQATFDEYHHGQAGTLGPLLLPVLLVAAAAAAAGCWWRCWPRPRLPAGSARCGPSASRSHAARSSWPAAWPRCTGPRSDWMPRSSRSRGVRRTSARRLRADSRCARSEGKRHETGRCESMRRVGRHREETEGGDR